MYDVCIRVNFRNKVDLTPSLSHTHTHTYRLRESETKLQSQVQELTRRENVLNMRLATKQEEMRNLLVSNHSNYTIP